MIETIFLAPVSAKHRDCISSDLARVFVSNIRQWTRNLETHASQRIDFAGTRQTAIKLKAKVRQIFI